MANVFDLGGSVARGLQTGMGVMQARKQNALADLYRTQGAQIAAGDPTALNALAQFDPMAVRGIRREDAADARANEEFGLRKQEFGMRQEAHGLDMELTRERILDIRRQSAEAAKAQAAQMDAAALERERQQLAGVVSGARQAIIQGPEAWEAFKASVPPDMWAQSGIDPASLTFETAPAALAMVVGMLDGVEEARQFSEGMQPQPDYVTLNDQLIDRNAPGGPSVVPVQGMQPKTSGFRQATPEEAAQYGSQAGQFGPDGKFYPINPPKGQRIEVGPDGTVRVIEGAGVGSESGPMVGEVYNPGEVESTIALIDEIMQDPNLQGVVGPMIGGGGNDVDNLNMVQRGLYGGEGLAVIQKVNQLQSRSWLAARQMLKGGGPITDYESRKAEAAVARLSRAQSEEAFMAALQDLRDAITEGMAKLEAARGGQQPQAPSQRDGGSIQEIDGVKYRVQRID